jgi:hypothetical protein
MESKDSIVVEMFLKDLIKEVRQASGMGQTEPNTMLFSFANQFLV